MTVMLYLHLAELLNEPDRRARAEWVLQTLAEPMSVHAPAFGYLLGAADLAVNGAVQVALVGEPDTPAFHELTSTVATTYVPSLVLAGGKPAHETSPERTIALLADRPVIDNRPTAYVCRGYVCDRPTTAAAELSRHLLTSHGRA
jgi:uncharacterized protein